MTQILVSHCAGLVSQVEVLRGTETAFCPPLMVLAVAVLILQGMDHHIHILLLIPAVAGHNGASISIRFLVLHITRTCHGYLQGDWEATSAGAICEH